jgi:chromosome partitioning protein
MATVAIYSLKGGVGKTTLSVNLAWCAATLSARRTLLWDLDPQAASTWVLGGTPGAGAKVDQAQAMFSKDVAVAKQARPTAYPHLDLIAADASLRGLDAGADRDGGSGDARRRPDRDSRHPLAAVDPCL